MVVVNAMALLVFEHHAILQLSRQDHLSFYKKNGMGILLLLCTEALGIQVFFCRIPENLQAFVKFFQHDFENLLQLKVCLFECKIMRKEIESGQ